MCQKPYWWSRTRTAPCYRHQLETQRNAQPSSAVSLDPLQFVARYLKMIPERHRKIVLKDTERFTLENLFKIETIRENLARHILK